MHLLQVIRNGRRLLVSGASCLLAVTVVACSPSSTTPATPAAAAPTTSAAKPTSPPSPAAAAPSPAAAAAPSPAASPVAGPATVKVTQNGSLGPILTDAAGRSLYMFANDKDKSSNCYDNCERNWPPLLTRGQPQAGDGAQAGKLSTTNRRDGSVQVVYGEYPLYYYTPDTAPGDVKGQGVGSVWYVLTPAGEPKK